MILLRKYYIEMLLGGGAGTMLAQGRGFWLLCTVSGEIMTSLSRYSRTCETNNSL